MFGTSSNGFTLLEVVVAIVIFALSISVLLKIQTNNISKVSDNLEKIRALNVLKEYVYNIPILEKEDEYKVEEQRKPFEFNLIKITYKVKKKDRTLIEMFEYELQRNR